MNNLIEVDETLHEALRLMAKALEIIDRDGKVGAIGAQLDLARARLSEHLEQFDSVRSS